MEKTCKKCKETMSIQEFYTHKQMGDGRLSFCKECVKSRVRKYGSTDHAKEIARAWAKTPKGRAKTSRGGKRHIEQNPEKMRCRRMSANAIRDGKITREPCRVCGDEKSESHHKDYTNPFNIDWLCRKHHRKIYHSDYYKGY